MNFSWYPFESNVNPAVPHPRWRQAIKRVIDSGDACARCLTTATRIRWRSCTRVRVPSSGHAPLCGRSTPWPADANFHQQGGNCVVGFKERFSRRCTLRDQLIAPHVRSSRSAVPVHFDLHRSRGAGGGACRLVQHVNIPNHLITPTPSAHPGERRRRRSLCWNPPHPEWSCVRWKTGALWSPSRCGGSIALPYRRI